jgi:hypothetical protein
MLLLLKREETVRLMSSLQTSERMFYFGFDTPDRVVLTRGPSKDYLKRSDLAFPDGCDFSPFVFARRLEILKTDLVAE